MNDSLKVIFTDYDEIEEEIDGNGIVSLSSSYKMFDNSFYLGGTASQSFNLEIRKDYITNYNLKDVIIKKGNTNLYTLKVDNVDDSSVDKYIYTLTDAMVNFEFKYDASQIFVGGKTTLLAILENICELAGIELATTEFDGDDMEISWYDTRITARQYIGMIAEINGGFARINRDGELELVKFSNTASASLDLEDCDEFIIGEKHKITRVVFDNGIFVASYGDETGNTLYLNIDNVYITSAEIVEAIYNSIKDFEFYNFETKQCPIQEVLGGDIINIEYDGTDYPIIAQYTISYFGSWSGYYSFEINSLKQEETKVLNGYDRYVSLKVEQDRENASIKIISEQQTEQGSKIATLEQSVDQIQTEIDDIPTITAEASGTGTLQLEDLIEMKLVALRIHPTDTDIIGLFASNLLKVNNGLKTLSRGITFDGQEDIYYKIPANLYFYNENIHDEFVYDAKEQRIYIIRNVAVDELGNKSALVEPVIEEYTYEDIIVSRGDYNIFMDTYPSAYIYVKAMISNDYTNFFATSYEVDSKITQTADEINLQVARKVDETEVISKINLSPEEIAISANKINLNGAVSANDNVIIHTDGTLEAVNGKFSGEVTASSGKIADYTISGAKLVGNNVGLSGTSGDGYAFWAGSDTPSSAPFRVGHTGSLKATNADISGSITGSTITGSSIKINTDNVTQGFKVYSTNNGTSFEIKSMMAQAIYNGQQTIALAFGTGSVICQNLSCSGSKQRIVPIDDGTIVGMNAYETATPYFGDIGSNKTDKNGECKIEIENIFSQTIEKDDYKVFIQECGEGHLWVEKHKNYFIVKGTPELEFDWEIKAIQKGYSNVRLEEYKEVEYEKE